MLVPSKMLHSLRCPCSNVLERPVRKINDSNTMCRDDFTNKNRDELILGYKIETRNGTTTGRWQYTR